MSFITQRLLKPSLHLRTIKRRLVQTVTLFKNRSENTELNDVTNQFLTAMKNVPSSVVVVTTSNGIIKRGVTCSSFTSVSSAPPILSFCIMQPSRMDSLLMETKKFIVNVLSEKQVHHSVHFSKIVDNEVDQFKDIPHTMSDNECPVLPNCSASLHCTAHSVHTVGDHHVWYGGVVKVTHSNETPLLYYARSYRSVGDQSFMQLFETATLAYEDWTHEAHLRMAWNYLMEYGKKEGTPLIKEGIKKYNLKHTDKIKRGYHETVTSFFIHMICTALDNTVNNGSGRVGTFEEFIQLNNHLTDSQLLFNYYSRELINSTSAKEQFVQPDVKQLP